MLWAGANLLSAVLALSATLFYVFVYTLWLKRTSTQNIVIGGAAGAVPVLVGWAAVRNDVTWAPVVLFTVMFLWTPPHFWALAIRYADDYRAANVPMLPAVKTAEVTARKMVGYTVVDGGLHARADPRRSPGSDLHRHAPSSAVRCSCGAPSISARTPRLSGRCASSDSASRTSRCCSRR